MLQSVSGNYIYIHISILASWTDQATWRHPALQLGSYVAEREELGFAALRAMLFEVTLQAQMHRAVAATPVG